jgi:hypothetical protein
METKFFALYLIPPRPDFALTMSDEERNIMMSHVQYWTKLMNQGLVVVFGPVLDPKEIYGLGIVKVESDEQLKSLIDNDPANGLNRYEFYPMRAVVSA